MKRNEITKKAPIVKGFEGSSTKTGTAEGDGAKKRTAERKQEDDNIYNIDTYTGSVPSIAVAEKARGTKIAPSKVNADASLKRSTRPTEKVEAIGREDEVCT
jgi:hypothetical protein